jgi:hypothetical protein
LGKDRSQAMRSSPCGNKSVISSIGSARHWKPTAAEERSVQLSREIWQRHEPDPRVSGDLFFTWQHDVRWATYELRKSCAMRNRRAAPGSLPWTTRLPLTPLCIGGDIVIGQQTCYFQIAMARMIPESSAEMTETPAERRLFERIRDKHWRRPSGIPQRRVARLSAGRSVSTWGGMTVRSPNGAGLADFGALRPCALGSRSPREALLAVRDS